MSRRKPTRDLKCILQGMQSFCAFAPRLMSRWPCAQQQVSYRPSLVFCNGIRKQLSLVEPALKVPRPVQGYRAQHRRLSARIDSQQLPYSMGHMLAKFFVQRCRPSVLELADSQPQQGRRVILAGGNQVVDVLHSTLAQHGRVEQ